MGNIQLKCYQPKSPFKIYQPYNERFLKPPVDKSLSLERNLLEKTKPLRKSSCPDRIKSSSLSDIKKHADFTYNRDILCNSTNREVEVLPFLSQVDLPCSEDEDIYVRTDGKDSLCNESIFTEDLQQTFTSSMESFSDNGYGHERRISESNSYHRDDQSDVVSNDVDNYVDKLHIEEKQRDPLLTTVNNERTSNENIINNTDTTCLVADNDRECLSPESRSEHPSLIIISTINETTNTEMTNEHVVDFTVLGDNIDNICTQIPLIVIEIVSDSQNEESSDDSASSTEEDPLLGNSTDENSTSNTSPTNMKLSDDTSRIQEELVRCPCNEKCSLSNEDVSASSYMDIPLGSESLDSLNVRQANSSTDSLTFSPCESIVSLNADDSVSMDDSSLGSYIIITSGNDEDCVT